MFGLDTHDLRRQCQIDIVELSTVYAGSYEGWASAVWDFVGTAGTRWNQARIIQEAFLEDCGCDVEDWGNFVKLLSDKSKSALRAALDSST